MGAGKPAVPQPKRAPPTDGTGRDPLQPPKSKAKTATTPRGSIIQSLQPEPPPASSIFTGPGMAEALLRAPDVPQGPPTSLGPKAAQAMAPPAAKAASSPPASSGSPDIARAGSTPASAGPPSTFVDQGREFPMPRPAKAPPPPAASPPVGARPGLSPGSARFSPAIVKQRGYTTTSYDLTNRQYSIAGTLLQFQVPVILFNTAARADFLETDSHRRLVGRYQYVNFAEKRILRGDDCHIPGTIEVFQGGPDSPLIIVMYTQYRNGPPTMQRDDDERAAKWLEDSFARWELTIS